MRVDIVITRWQHNGAVSVAEYILTLKKRKELAFPNDVAYGGKLDGEHVH